MNELIGKKVKVIDSPEFDYERAILGDRTYTISRVTLLAVLGQTIIYLEDHPYGFNRDSFEIVK